MHSSDSVLLPAVLVTVSSILVIYQHFADADTSRHSVRNFLAKILISMVPLVILEKKILQCPDPIALFAKFSAKVMLMHAAFLCLRLSCLLIPNVEVGYTYCNTTAFVAAFVMLGLVFKVRPSLRSVIEHADVLALVGITCAIALGEVSVLGRFSFFTKWTRSMWFEDLILTGSDYIEILAFVPAVWMACRKDAGQPDADLQDCQKRALCLFAFLLGFYIVEDVVNAYTLSRDYPVACCGHVAHFLLLLDFAGFLLAHLYDPDKFAKIRSTVMGWVADVCAV